MHPLAYPIHLTLTVWAQAFSLLQGAAPTVPGAGPAPEGTHVILLHGLARTSASLTPLAEALRRMGYHVHNVYYPSTTAPVAQLAGDAIPPALAAARAEGAKRIHFVTHSMGGILVRHHLSGQRVPELGRVVMLGPPNQGSEVVDRLGGWRVFRAINGPAGNELGTAPGSLPNTLGPVSFPLGIVAGNRSVNWINSLLIPGPDDGKVAVERTKVAGMADHLVLPVNHPLMMKHPAVIGQVLHFLAHGRFARGIATQAGSTR